jgi:hypothetical protein
MPILSMTEIIRVNTSTTEFDGVYIPTASSTLVVLYHY